MGNKEDSIVEDEVPADYDKKWAEEFWLILMYMKYKIIRNDLIKYYVVINI